MDMRLAREHRQSGMKGKREGAARGQVAPRGMGELQGETPVAASLS